MTTTEKDDLRLTMAFIAAIAFAFCVIGYFNGIDNAMEAQARHNRLSVYCQQPGAIETLCNDLKEGGR